MLARILILSAAGLTAHDINERAGADYVQRSLDKTIVVEPKRTYTVPGRRGQGTHYQYEQDTRDELEETLEEYRKEH